MRTGRKIAVLLTACLSAAMLVTGCGTDESSTAAVTSYVEDIPEDDPAYMKYKEEHGLTSETDAGSGTTEQTESEVTGSTASSDSSAAASSTEESTESSSAASSDKEEAQAGDSASGESSEASTEAAAEASTQETETTAASDPSTGTLTGTIGAGSSNTVLLLDTGEDELQIQFNTSTDVSECSGIEVGKKVSITYTTDENGNLVAAKVADAQ